MFSRELSLKVDRTVHKYNAHLKLVDGDAVVSVADHHLAAEVLHRLELGGQEQARGAKQLELACTNSKNK